MVTPDCVAAFLRLIDPSLSPDSLRDLGTVRSLLQPLLSAPLPKTTSISMLLAAAAKDLQSVPLSRCTDVAEFLVVAHVLFSRCQDDGEARLVDKILSLPVRLQTEIQLLLRQYTDADSSSEYLLSARDRPKDRSANMSELAELRAAKAEIERLRLGAVQDKQK
ncbi:MAG: uncharacterized protein KVP18_005213 [Porospora cf. gigantea A]|uniref:uncharacterized protein n=1 Tax=Porospora cf. gigantea A TaxID=2853593 RepID=UPI003559DC54|nr:MAG: hypothetical protein KVP18_005213 [Porospora cf. gigantea A]